MGSLIQSVLIGVTLYWAPTLYHCGPPGVLREVCFVSLLGQRLQRLWREWQLPNLCDVGPLRPQPSSSIWPREVATLLVAKLEFKPPNSSLKWTETQLLVTFTQWLWLYPLRAPRILPALPSLCLPPSSPHLTYSLTDAFSSQNLCWIKPLPT